MRQKTLAQRLSCGSGFFKDNVSTAINAIDINAVAAIFVVVNITKPSSSLSRPVLRLLRKAG